MGRSPADLKLVFSSLVNAGLWNSDPSTLPIPWRESHEKLPEKLVFGWANGDGHVQPLPPVQRAMHEVKDALEALSRDGKTLGTSKVGWETVRSTAMWYIQRKENEHRFDGRAPQGKFNYTVAATYCLLTNKETIP